MKKKITCTLTIKKFIRRPEHWNDKGHMDYLMGRRTGVIRVFKKDFDLGADVKLFVKDRIRRLKSEIHFQKK